MKEGNEKLFERYATRFIVYSQFCINDPITESVKVRVVIPCYNEPDLLKTLDSLVACNEPENPVEVIVVLNHSEADEESIKQRSQQTFETFYEWKERQKTDQLRFFAIRAFDLPDKKAGVGMARKIGMDEAFRRFSQQGETGHIVCLDADCTVSTNYLIALESNLNEEVRGGHLAFIHDIEHAETAQLQEGIIRYELHLRVHQAGLRYAGFAFAHQTVGSCMIVRSDVYGQLGGMNHRKAGEDFYFMHKVYPGGKTVQINEAFVYPSSRISDRVPFGTGKAQGKWTLEQSREYFTYSSRIYSELKPFFHKVYRAYSQAFYPGDEPGSLKDYLAHSGFWNRLDSTVKRSTGTQTYLNNLNQWFDAFYILKLVHYLRDEHFGEQEVGAAASNLLLMTDQNKPKASSPHELLNIFRAREYPEYEKPA